MHETDPANLQPKVRPLNLRIGEFIRANAVVDLPVFPRWTRRMRGWPGG